MIKRATNAERTNTPKRSRGGANAASQVPVSAEANYIDGGRGGRGSYGGGRGGRGGNRGGGLTSTLKCYNYGKPGYREKDCRSKYIPGNTPPNWTWTEGKGLSATTITGSSGNT